MKELIDQTNLENKKGIVAALENAGITERDIPNLPRITGVRIAGVSAYRVQSALMQVLASKDESHMDVIESEPEPEPQMDMEAAFGSRIAGVLRGAGYSTVESVAALTEEQLLGIDGISDKSASKIAEAIS